MRHRFEMRKKVMLTMAILTIVPVIIMGVVSAAQAKRIIVEKMESINASNMVILNQQVTSKLELLASTLHALPENNIFRACIDQTPTDRTEYYAANEQLRSELGSARNLLGLGLPASYLVLLDNGIYYSDITSGTDVDQLYPQLHERLRSASWYQMLCDASYSRSIWLHEQSLLSSLGGRMVYRASNLIIDGKNRGVMLIGLSETYLRRILKSAMITKNSRIVLCSSDAACMIASDMQPFDPELLSAENNQTMRIDGEQCMVLSSKLSLNSESGKWRLYMQVPLSDLYQEVSLLYWLTAAMILMCCVAILIMMLCVNRWLLHPVLELSGAMRRAQQGDFTVRAQVSYHDELGDLSEGFNDMISALENSIQRIHHDEQAKHKLEIRLLQEQINPHFIRNTLNTVRWMAELKGAVGISKAITAFIHMINYSFEYTETDITLADELAYLEQYIYIQKLRYQNLFTYRTQIPPELLRAKVPKLILQPVIENSILHGITEQDKMGSITLTAAAEDNTLCMSVYDDGQGIEPEKIAEIMNGTCRVSDRGSSHIGLYNIIERLRLLYGRGDMQIESEKGVYTRVSIRIPLELKEE